MDGAPTESCFLNPINRGSEFSSNGVSVDSREYIKVVVSIGEYEKKIKGKSAA